MFYPGDLVDYVTPYKKIRAKIFDIEYDYLIPVFATIDFVDDKLIPNRMKVPYTHLQQVSYTLDPVCECGLKFVREGGAHSSWCPAYTEEK